ncbi:MAG: undecaprenyl-diphosphate phosphatase [Halothermotrichaceae bacterium]
MNLIKVIIIGIVQGLTEFLPVSSSGHLVLALNLLGIKETQLTFVVFLHFGTLIPIFIIFWEDIKGIITFKKEKRRLIWLILVGIIPTGLMGYFFEDFFTGFFESTLFVGYMLLITGFLLYISERLTTVKINISQMKEHNAIIIGIAQGLAIFPGISRSGSTIVASLFQGLDRDSAARYSFLISIPVILGASLLELKATILGGMEVSSWWFIIVGTITAAISGYFAIKYLLHLLKKRKLTIFAYYCWVIGLLIIIGEGIF